MDRMLVFPDPLLPISSTFFFILNDAVLTKLRWLISCADVGVGNTTVENYNFRYTRATLGPWRIVVKYNSKLSSSIFFFARTKSGFSAGQIGYGLKRGRVGIVLSTCMSPSWMYFGGLCSSEFCRSSSGFSPKSLFLENPPHKSQWVRITCDCDTSD